MRRGSLFEPKHSSTDSTDLNRFGEKVAAAYVKLIEFHRIYSFIHSFIHSFMVGDEELFGKLQVNVSPLV